MGLYTNVVFTDNTVLPEQYRHIQDWQTRDVVDRLMCTLEIDQNGQLFHLTWDLDLVDDVNSFFDVYFKRVNLLLVPLKYTGLMLFYCNDVSLTAYFVNGILEKIDE